MDEKSTQSGTSTNNPASPGTLPGSSPSNPSAANAGNSPTNAASPSMSEAAASTSKNFRETAAEAGATVKKEAQALRGQAADKARQMADQGKERTTDALDSIAKLIGDTASTVDDRIGNKYGDYTRKAADAVSGFATTLRGKDVDDVVKDAGEFVRKSPAVAIGAAAAVGFVLARLIKSASDTHAGSNPEKDGESSSTSHPNDPSDKFSS